MITANQQRQESVQIIEAIGFSPESLLPDPTIAERFGASKKERTQAVAQSFRRGILAIHEDTNDETSLTHVELLSPEDQVVADVVYGQIYQAGRAAKYAPNFSYTPTRPALDKLVFGVRARNVAQKVALVGSIDRTAAIAEKVTVDVLAHKSNIFETPLTKGAHVDWSITKISQDRLKTRHAYPKVLALIAIAEAARLQSPDGTQVKAKIVEDDDRSTLPIVVMKHVVSKW